ncbi:unnamed protein product [Rotaria socialis]|uniref:Uncharacterized protein n=1 Tax=Rotaria socialis TaxID=392032 RepID=A0A821P3C7_9BILA|nr:unnamed protein product [Rotaria socialis]CAF4794691.1 unnamed protein product [Rotaria socialis]
MKQWVVHILITLNILNIMTNHGKVKAQSSDCRCHPTPYFESGATPCSTNPSCKCLWMTLTEQGICADTAISCSSLLACTNNGKACSPPNTVCVNNTRCSGPVCYPLARASSERCPLSQTDAIYPIPRVSNINTISGFYAHGSSLLSNGDLLIDGGSSAAVLTHVYNPSTGLWKRTGNLLVARAYHTLTLLRNDKVLIAGGKGADSIPNSVELYDAYTGLCTMTGSMKEARDTHTASVLPNGQVLVVGGNNTITSVNTAEIFNPLSEEWTTINNMSVNRTLHTASILANGNVLVAGGETLNGPLSSAEVYDFTTGHWSKTSDMNVPRSRHTATVLNDGRVLIVGGRLSKSYYTSTTEIYDPYTNLWSKTGNMTIPRQRHTASLLMSGNVLVLGGISNSVYVNTAEVYDPVSDVWSTTSNINNERGYHTTTVLPDGDVLVVGGLSNGGFPLWNSELYS